MKTSLFAVILLAALAVPAAADRAEEDLQVVRKAVSSSSRVAQARPPAEEPPAEAKPAPRKAGPRWFRVRITEKGGRAYSRSRTRRPRSGCGWSSTRRDPPSSGIPRDFVCWPLSPFGDTPMSPDLSPLLTSR